MKKLKKSQIALGLAALTIVSTVGLASASMAATTDASSSANATSTSPHVYKFFKHQKNDVNSAANIAARAAKKAAIESAISANDYNAWVTAVGPNAPILKKINATNFGSYVQAYNLEKQAQSIMTGLGLTKGEGWGAMMGGANGHMGLNASK